MNGHTGKKYLRLAGLIMIRNNNSNEVAVVRKILFVLLLYILGLCLVQPSLAFDEYESENMREIRELFEHRSVLLAENHEKLQPFTGSGRVLDQDGDPVSGAEVEVHWAYLDPDQDFKKVILKKWVKADMNGDFTFTLEKAHEPYINNVKSREYEFKRNLSPYFTLNPSEEKRMMANSENEPILLYMRKLNSTTFLLKSGVSHYFKEPNTTLRYTMIPGLLRPIDPDLSKLKKPEQNDLIFTVNKNGDGSYTMHIQPVPEIGGSMQILDDYLYAAPTGGYSQEISLTIRPEDGKVTKYLYFTSRKSSVYSRMEMELRVRDEGDLQFHSSTWSNPYGKRNLEWEPELPNKLRHKLRNEAEEALINGKLVEEPTDLQALIDQYLAVETN
jgi:hypothetical protein